MIAHHLPSPFKVTLLMNDKSTASVCLVTIVIRDLLNNAVLLMVTLNGELPWDRTRARPYSIDAAALGDKISGSKRQGVGFYMKTLAS